MKRIFSVVIGAVLAAAASAEASLTQGEVRKVDKEAKTLTIRHAPIQKFEMPAMTMEFYVKDPALLDQVKRGDKIKFDAEKVRGGYAVNRIEPAK